MDPLLLSLVHQFLESTKSNLTDEFKARYQPAESDMTLKKVVSKWKEEQLARGLVYQHLKKSPPLLALEFAKSYQYLQGDTSKRLMELIEEDQLIRCLVLQHLREVTLTLASEFRGKNNVFLETIPEKLMLLLLDETSKNNLITAKDQNDLGQKRKPLQQESWRGLRGQWQARRILMLWQRKWKELSILSARRRTT